MEWLTVGRIVNTHGIRGEVRIISSTDFPEVRYRVGSELAAFKKRSKEPIPVIVTSHRKHKNFDLLTFEGYGNVNDVEPFKGGLLKVSTEHLHELEEGAYYHFEIIGCDVYDIETDERIGEVTEVLTTGANDVWEVRDDEGVNHYIPHIPIVVKSVDIEAKRIDIELMEGLLNK